MMNQSMMTIQVYNDFVQSISFNVSYIYLETDEQAGWVKSYTKSNYIIRKSCANFIWSAWAYERLWGPRYGVILISIMEASAEKVCFIGDIIDIREESQICV